MLAVPAVLGVAVSLALSASPARADAGNGTGPGGDGRLHLIPEVITNSGISAGGSADFPVKARLFLPEMEQRAQAIEESESTIVRAAEGLTFDSRTNELFAHDYAEVRAGLFADYTAPLRPRSDATVARQTDALWIIVMGVGSIPLAFLAVFLGRKTAKRTKGHARTTH